MRAALAVALLATACSGEPDMHCPTFSRLVIYPQATLYPELSDNAAQCQMYWASRLSAVDEGADVIADVVMAKCSGTERQRIETGLKDGVLAGTAAENLRYARQAVLAEIVERRWRKCPSSK